MGGQQHQPVLGCLGKEVAEVDALLRVQAHGGLVKDEELRVSQQSLGDSHPLALASGESADSGPALLLQIDGPDDLVDGGAAVPQPLQGSHVVQELIDGELVIQAEGLGEIAQTGFERPLGSVQRVPVHQDGALGGQEGGHQQLHQGGLARPVGAQKPHQAGAGQVQVQSLEGLFPAGIGHREILDLDLHGSTSFRLGFHVRIPVQCGERLKKRCVLYEDGGEARAIMSPPGRQTGTDGLGLRDGPESGDKRRLAWGRGGLGGCPAPRCCSRRD